MLFGILLLGVISFWALPRILQFANKSTKSNTVQPPAYSFSDITIKNYNNSVNGKVESPPFYAVNGVVVLGSGDSKYGLMHVGDSSQSVYPLDTSFIRLGSIFRNYAGTMQRVPLLSSLGNYDEIYLTYYADRKQGIARGIVRSVERIANRVTVGLLDDPDDSQYVIPTTLTIATSDPSLYFDLKGKTLDDLASGNIVWMTFIPNTQEMVNVFNITSVTLQAPAYRQLRGMIGEIEAGSDVVTFSLDTSSIRIQADRTSVIYSYSKLPEMGIENFRKKSLPFDRIQAGKTAVVFAYIAGDHWNALAVGLDPTR